MTVLVSVLQLLLAGTFVVMPVVAYRYGTAAQRAADADAMRQGLPAGSLAEHGIRMEESKAEMMLPLAIALVLAVLASLNLAGAGAGRTLTWILQPLMLLAGGFVTAGQVFVVRYVEAAVRKSTDPVLRGVDVNSFISAAQAKFPAWVRPVVITRFVLATVGSALIIVLLAFT
jgi:hypothetical protein